MQVLSIGKDRRISVHCSEGDDFLAGMILDWIEGLLTN